MKCESCNKEMLYFQDKQTCGWKCNTCGTIIVTTYNDEIENDNSLYNITILPNNNTSAINVKVAAKICNCSFIDSKKLLVSGIEIDKITAVQAREIINNLQTTDIKFSTTPEFKHSL